MARVQRRDHDAADQQAPAGRDRRREHEGNRQARDGIAHPERDRGRHTADRPIGAERRDLAEGQIDPSDQPVDQRIRGREQRVDRRERDGVDQLLQRIGNGGGQLRQRLRRRCCAALAFCFRQEALEIEKPRLAEHALVGLGRD